jgi:hypothetical protein
MANPIQRSISDKGRRALRRFTPAVCERAWNLWGYSSTYYEVGAALGLHPHQARSAIDAWGEVRLLAGTHGMSTGDVVAEVMAMGRGA